MQLNDSEKRDNNFIRVYFSIYEVSFKCFMSNEKYIYIFFIYMREILMRKIFLLIKEISMVFAVKYNECLRRSENVQICDYLRWNYHA